MSKKNSRTKFVPNRTKNVTYVTKNFREQDLFQIEQKMLQEEQTRLMLRLGNLSPFYEASITE